MTWTKKHDKFALACNLSESQGYVLRDILRKGKPNEATEAEIDLRKTNAWIGKVRAKGAYHRKTITGAIAQLDEKTMGMVTILRRYNPWVYKVLIRPLAFVEENQGAKCDSTHKPETGNLMFSDDHKKQARELLLQNISKLDSLFQKLGMRYTPDALMRIWRLAGKSLSEVKSAVEYLLKVNARKRQQQFNQGEEPIGLPSPKGWLHECLRGGWHNNEDYVDLPYVEREQVYTFVDSLMGKIPHAPT